MRPAAPRGPVTMREAWASRLARNAATTWFPQLETAHWATFGHPAAHEAARRGLFLRLDRSSDFPRGADMGHPFVPTPRSQARFEFRSFVGADLGDVLIRDQRLERQLVGTQQ